MKSQVFTILLLTIGTLLFQSTHQYRLEKRELTEYDLTNFIVNTCSADNNDMLIQNLCDQTLQSALMGNFPFLIYYCKMIGTGNRYCDNINQQTLVNSNIEVKRFAARRFTRSLKEIETDTNSDLKSKEIIRKCLTNSNEINGFCKQKLHEIQQGKYPGIKQLCQYHSDRKFCQNLLLSSWLSINESSSPKSDHKNSFVSFDSISNR